MQLELFDYRKDYLFNTKNQIAHYYDILKETEDSISYSEHIDPKKNFSICGMDYEEYVDIKKNQVNGFVKLKLYKGNVTILSRQSKSKAYSVKKVSFEENKSFKKSKVERFILGAARKLRA